MSSLGQGCLDGRVCGMLGVEACAKCRQRQGERHVCLQMLCSSTECLGGGKLRQVWRAGLPASSISKVFTV